MKKNILELIEKRQTNFDENTREILVIFSLNFLTALRSVLKVPEDIEVEIYNILPLEINPKYVTLFRGLVSTLDKENEVYTPLNIIVPISILEENYEYDEMKRVLSNIINFLSMTSNELFDKMSDIYITDIDGRYFIDLKNDSLISLKGLQKNNQMTLKA